MIFARWIGPSIRNLQSSPSLSPFIINLIFNPVRKTWYIVRLLQKRPHNRSPILFLTFNLVPVNPSMTPSQLVLTVLVSTSPAPVKSITSTSLRSPVDVTCTSFNQLIFHLPYSYLHSRKCGIDSRIENSHEDTSTIVMGILGKECFLKERRDQ